MSIVFGYYSAPTRAAGQGKWNFFRGVGVCFGLLLPVFLAFFVAALVVVVVLGVVVLMPSDVCRCPVAVGTFARCPVATSHIWNRT
jgi:hypothetical protein